MKPEIVQITRIWDEAMCKYYYQVTIDFEELPNLKIGKCEVKQ